MRRHILPALGDRRVDAVTAKDVCNWFDDLSVARGNGEPGAGGAVVNDEVRRGARPAAGGLQPACKGLRRRKTGFEAHYLTDDEFAALGRTLDGAEAEWPVAVAVLRFLLHTGPRRARGAAKAHQLPLGVCVALRRPRERGQGMERYPRAAAGLGKLRIHDLRHSHAAVAVGGGASSPGCSAMPTSRPPSAMRTLPRTPCSRPRTGSRAALPTCSTAGRRADDRTRPPDRCARARGPSA